MTKKYSPDMIMLPGSRTSIFEAEKSGDYLLVKTQTRVYLEGRDTPAVLVLEGVGYACTVESREYSNDLWVCLVKDIRRDDTAIERYEKYCDTYRQWSALGLDEDSDVREDARQHLRANVFRHPNNP